MLPGQVSARDEEDAEGVVLRGARAPGWVSPSTAGCVFATVAEASNAEAEAESRRVAEAEGRADGLVRESHLRVGELLGEGAYGTVHRATWHEPTFAAPLEVAVKTLRASATPTRRETRTFAREAAVLRRLDHPGVVRLLGASLAPHRAFILQELVPGGSLHDFIHGKPRGHPRGGRRLTRDESARVCGEVASAMAYLARRGVVHRDLKSQNVLLTSTRPDGPRGAKVADFGIAKSLAHATGGGEGWTVGGTAGGGCAGTPAWMAPELFRGTTEGGGGRERRVQFRGGAVGMHDGEDAVGGLGESRADRVRGGGGGAKAAAPRGGRRRRDGRGVTRVGGAVLGRGAEVEADIRGDRRAAGGDAEEVRERVNAKGRRPRSRRSAATKKTSKSSRSLLAAHRRAFLSTKCNDSVVRFGSTSRGVRTSRAVALASSDGERASGAR